MLDHEERFLFREEIHNLATALNDAGQLDNVEDLLAEVTTSPRFDADVFTLERSLQVRMSGVEGPEQALADQFEFAILQIAQAAMHHARQRAAASPEQPE